MPIVHPGPRLLPSLAETLFLRPFLLVATLFLGAQPLPAVPPRSVTFYDSQAHGNDFSGTRSLQAIGFTDVHGGVASFRGGNLVLTPDDTNGGEDAYLRDYVLREAAAEQARDMGCRVVLPANSLAGNATLGLCLRFQATGSGLILNFAPGANTLYADSLADGVTKRRASAPLVTPYVAADPVAVEARVIADAAVTLTATDLATKQILGFLNVPLDFGTVPAGGFGLVPRMTAAGRGSIAVASVQSYAVTAVVCDGDSLTYGENDSFGKGTASPLALCYPGVLQKLLGNRYHVFNLGRSGLTVTHMNSDAASRVDALVARAEQPPIVVLEGGTNDFGIDGSIKPPMLPARAAETVYGRLQTYWSARHAARADTRVIDLTNTPAAHPVYVSNLGSLAGFNQRRDALNALRKNTTAGPRPDFVADDAADPRIGRDGDEQNATYFAAKDKTHLTEAGYAIKADVVARVIQQVIPSRP